MLQLFRKKALILVAKLGPLVVLVRNVDAVDAVDAVDN